MRSVVIVEDHTAIVPMIKSAIEAIAGHGVVGCAGGASEGKELCRRLQPDLLILDLMLANGSGMALLGELRSVSPRTRAIVFSGNLRTASIRAALLSGAHGLVEKTASLDEFEQAVRAVGSGRIYYSRFASEEIRRMVNGSSGRRAGPVRLTDREKAVLRGLAEGLSSKEIATRLGISRHTVVNHRTRLASKTGLRGVARLSRYAMQLGLIGDLGEGIAAEL